MQKAFLETFHFSLFPFHSVRILHINKYHHERDGVGRYMFGLIREAEKEGHTTAVFAMHDARNIASPWEKHFVSNLDTARAAFGFGALRQFGRALWSREAARKMRAMLTAFHPDVVHVHNIYTHLSPSVLAECKKFGVPVVMTVHDYALVSANYALWNGDRPLVAGRNSFLSVARSRFIKGSFVATAALELVTRLHRVFGLYDRYIDRYVTLSAFVKNTLVAVGYDATKITVVPPGVERRGDPRGRPGNDVVFVGRLEEYKGAHIFIDAMRLLKGASARIVGDGAEREVLEEQARGMRNVRFDGFLVGNALEAAYASARVVVVPSLWYEPFGLVALEAMARGVPVIVSDRGGLPEVVGESGTTVAAGDEKALAAAILRFFDDPVFAEEMGDLAKKRSLAFPGHQEHFAQIQGIYESCG